MSKIIQINTAKKLSQESKKKLSKIIINELIKQINLYIRDSASNGYGKIRFDFHDLRNSTSDITWNLNFPNKEQVSEVLQYFKDGGYIVKEEDTLLTRWYEVIWEVEDEHQR
mgnify:FL=1